MRLLSWSSVRLRLDEVFVIFSDSIPSISRDNSYRLGAEATLSFLFEKQIPIFLIIQCLYLPLYDPQ